MSEPTCQCLGPGRETPHVHCVKCGQRMEGDGTATGLCAACHRKAYPSLYIAEATAPRESPNSLAPLVAALREPVSDEAARDFRLNLEACLAREDPYAYHHALEQFVRDALQVRESPA